MWAMYLLAAQRGWAGALRRRVFGSLRVMAYVACVSLVACVLLARHALAQVSEQSFALGRHVLPFAELAPGTTVLRINGEKLYFSTVALRDTSVKQALDRAQAECKQQPGPLAREMMALAQRVPSGVPGSAHIKQLLEQVALNRDEDDNQGLVICMTGKPGGTEPSGPPDGALGARFAQSMDLGELGNLRYVMATRGSARENQQQHTRLMAMWTDGHFRLNNLAPPARGDAPGSDSSLIPRFPNSIRILTAEAPGTAHAFRVYRSKARPEEILSFYDQRMKDWQGLERKDFEGKARAYIKDGRPIVISLTRDQDETLVTLSEVGAAGEGRAQLAERSGTER